MPKKPGSIDWETVWKSLDWDDEQRQQAAERERLRQRARQYAAPPAAQAAAPEDSRPLLIFTLGRERYGVDVMLVRGVRTARTIARLPGAPSFYRGVTNVRGRIITVMDLRYFFDIPVEADAENPVELVITRSNDLEIGLLAHQINGISAVSPATIKPVEHMPYMAGMTADRVIVLQMAWLLADERLIVGSATSSGQ
ncbi:MAG: purine-binding chemotaxis protein CheW [Chloroflexi bacterium]|nr:purine-binding chemotaxis protein CheW [Chloroflexota bacterium]